MIIISHRGNIDGPNNSMENHPTYILRAINNGYDVEIDLWKKDEKIFLGHDKPEYEININFLLENKNKFWIHAKNIDAAYYLTNFENLNWFFHDQDDCVLTSHGYLWTYPGKQLTPMSIAVMPERIKEKYDLSLAKGICTDYPKKY